MASTIKLTAIDILNIPHYVRTLKAQAWRRERAYKKEKGTCWFMSEINSILRTAAASIFRPARLLHFPIIASTSHFFHTSSPRLGITGMQFPVNNIPRHESALLRRIHSSFLGFHKSFFPTRVIQHTSIKRLDSFLCLHVNSSIDSSFISWALRVNNEES